MWEDEDKSYIKRWKSRIKWLLLVLICSLFCVEWGVSEQVKQTDVPPSNSMPTGQEATVPAQGVVSLINVTPTIWADDPVNENMAGMLQDVAKGVIVQIHMNQVGGSGVIWRVDGAQLVIVTAAHVLAENLGQVQITFADGYQVESSEYVIESSADVAFVYVALENIPQEYLSGYYVANVDKNKYDEIASDDIVIAIGSVSEPGGEAYEGTLTETWIWVEDFNQYMMIAKLVADAGMSGGGVFDEEGYFLGILCGVNENNEAAILPLVIIESVYQGISQ